MNANELRINNYVLFNGKNNSIGKISEIRQSIFPGMDKVRLNNVVNKLHFISNLRPITLTEEWLLKLGFQKNEIPTSLKGIKIINYQKENFVVYLLDNSFEIELINKSGQQFNLFINFKKEVHTLQNAYFSLKQKELTAN